MMTYADGTQARIGDAVVDDGEHTGTVMHVLDSPEDVAAWELEEPGLMIDTSYGGLVFYPPRSLIAEAVALVARGDSQEK